MNFTYALLSMFGFGLYQFFLKTIKKTNTLTSLLHVRLIVLILAAPLLLFFKLVMPNFQTLLFILLTGLVGSVALGFLFKAIEIGKVSLVTPIANIYSLPAIVFAFLIFGEVLKLTDYIFGLLILLGVFFVALKRKEIISFKVSKEDIKPISFSLIFAVLLALHSNILRIIQENTGAFSAFYYSEASMTFWVILYFLIKKPKFTKPDFHDLRQLFLTGFSQGFGGIFFLLAISTVGISFATLAGAANPLIIITLAFFFLKERIEWNQLIGVLITIIGLIGLVI